MGETAKPDRQRMWFNAAVDVDIECLVKLQQELVKLFSTSNFAQSHDFKIAIVYKNYFFRG